MAGRYRSVSATLADPSHDGYVFMWGGSYFMMNSNIRLLPPQRIQAHRHGLRQRRLRGHQPPPELHGRDPVQQFHTRQPHRGRLHGSRLEDGGGGCWTCPRCWTTGSEKIPARLPQGWHAGPEALASSRGFLADRTVGTDPMVIRTLKEVQVLIESWRQHYNTVRPHSSL